VQAAATVQVVVAGIDGEALANVQAALVLPELLRDEEIDRAWFERFTRQVPRLASEALKPFGYYHPAVTVQAEAHEEGGQLLQVEIAPGEPVRIAAISVTVDGTGGTEPPLQEQLRAFPLNSGDILRQDLYEDAKERLKNQAVDLGYLAAVFSVQRITIDLATNLAIVELRLVTGSKYRFGEARINGAPDYPQAFLRRYLAFSEGETFSYPRLGQTQLNFVNSDRFVNVIVTPQPEGEENLDVPVAISLDPSPRRRLRPGIGYGTDTGARFTLNYRDVNVLQRGHEFSLELKPAERQQSLTAGYIIPSHRHLSDRLALRTGFDRSNLDTYETRTFFVETEAVRAFSGDRLGSVYLRLLQEDFIIGEEDDRSRLLLPGIQLSGRRYDDPRRPRRGYHYRLEVRGTHQALGSDTGLLQLLATANTLQPLPWGLSLFARVQGGATWQNEPLREIPPSLRFFAGGDQSVRGYSYQSLGPRDSNDEVVGGKHLLVGSLEVERPLTDDWGVAIFCDAGNAFDRTTDYEIFAGAGLGLRRYTPVGPLKIDLARQLGEADPSFRLHVSFGILW
jgi:translocation and assembly module TamA